MNQSPEHGAMLGGGAVYLTVRTKYNSRTRETCTLFSWKSFVESKHQSDVLPLLTLLRQADKFAIPRDASFNSIVVPTMDTVRNEYLIHNLVMHGHHVLCTGDTGTGKSVTAKKKLLFGMGPKFSSIMLNFSAQTSANQVCLIVYCRRSDAAFRSMLE